MLQCPNCKEVKEVGKFCGKCGVALQEKEEQATEEKVETAEPCQSTSDNSLDSVPSEDAEGQEEAHSQVEQQPFTVTEEEGSEQQAAIQEMAAAQSIPLEPKEQTTDYKENAKAYWQYFLDLLKNPANALQFQEQKFTFGLINLILYVITFTAAIYFPVRSFIKSFGLLMMDTSMGIGNGELFKYLLMPTFIVAVLFLGLALILLYVFERIFVKQMSIHQFVAQYGGILTPLIVLHLIGLIIGLAGSLTGVFVFLGISLFLSTYMITALFIYEKMTFYRSHEQRIYISIGLTISILIATYIVGRTTVYNMVLELIEDFLGVFNYF